jgi:hypothetical protein
MDVISYRRSTLHCNCWLFRSKRFDVSKQLVRNLIRDN